MTFCTNLLRLWSFNDNLDFKTFPNNIRILPWNKLLLNFNAFYDPTHRLVLLCTFLVTGNCISNNYISSNHICNAELSKPWTMQKRQSIPKYAEISGLPKQINIFSEKKITIKIKNTSFANLIPVLILLTDIFFFEVQAKFNSYN